MSKKQLGQFFTTNSDYILQGLEPFIAGKTVTDPFAGGADLIRWAKKNGAKSIKGFDIDKKYIDKKNVFWNDSINNPLEYKFVLTNPPYLHKNKADKETKKLYFNEQFEDLYQRSLFSIMNSDEGVAIVPINFLSADNSSKIRNIFFSKFEIVRMNYFKQQVFPDTTYNVIAFYYRKKMNQFLNKFSIKTCIYPDDKFINIELAKKSNWAIGGDFLAIIKKQKNELGVHRLTEKDILIKRGEKEVMAAFNHVKNVATIHIDKETLKVIKNNLILLKAIDTGTEKGKIALENIKDYNVECLISKESSRNMIYLLFEKKVSISEQEKIIALFNQEINKLREEYLSLFLTNFRDNDRKRISFDFAYKFINYLYYNRIANYAEKQSVLL